MTREIILWRVFLEALKNQPEPRLDNWLSRWRFSDAGVFAKLDSVETSTETRNRSEAAAASFMFYRSMPTATLH